MDFKMNDTSAVGNLSTLEDDSVVSTDISEFIKTEQDVESEMQRRCLICYYLINSEESLVDTHKSYKLAQIYKTLNIKSSSKIKTLCEDFEPPLCALCNEIVEKTLTLGDQLQELESALSLLREQIKEKLIISLEENTPELTDPLCDFMTTVNSIRQDAMKSISKYSSFSRKKKVGRPKKGKEEKLNQSDDIKNPFVLLEPLPGFTFQKNELESKSSLKEKTLPGQNQARTSRGRLIKRPKTFVYASHISSESEEEENKPLWGDELEDDQSNYGNEMAEVIMEDTPDPEWSPGHEGHYYIENEDCATSSSEEDSEYLDEDELQNESNIKQEQSEQALPNRYTQRKSKRKHRQRLEDSSRKRKSSIKIPVKVLAADGEELEAVFLKDENDEGTNGEDTQTIEPGCVISSVDKMMRIRIKCTEGCAQTFNGIERMKIHVKRAHQGITQPYNCSICEKTFGSPRQLKYHMKEHGVKPSDDIAGNRKYHYCDFEGCNQKYRNPSELIIHVRTAHTHEKPFQCGHCTESFVSSLKREFHIESAHQDVPPLRCEHCPRGFFRQHRLRDHVKIHTGERSYLCEICSKSFSQPAYLRYHQTQHKELELQQYKCNLCDKTFATPVNLRIHNTTQHQKDYRYRCEICNHGATHMSHLKLHMRTHSGERPHVCELCHKSFTRGSQLKIHYRSHTGERPYICKVCPKTFTNSSKLRRHEASHSQVKPYKCRICEKGFTQMTNLNSHMKCAHTNKKDKKEKTVSKMKTEEEVEEIEDFQPHVYGITQQNLSTMPIQFQVVNASESLESEPTYTEFIILNQV